MDITRKKEVCGDCEFAMPHQEEERYRCINKMKVVEGDADACQKFEPDYR